MNLNLPFPELYPIILETIQPTTRVFLVGGGVRDLILGCTPQDIDLALSSGVRQVSRKIANYFKGAVYSLDDERQTMRVLVEYKDHPWKLDIALLRGGSLESDLRTRDFSINAMAIEIMRSGNHQFIDLLDGKEHLRKKIITACSPTSILDDPIRILRAERMAIRFHFAISKSTQQQMVEAASEIVRVSGERQRDELFKLLSNASAEDGLNHLSHLGIFTTLFPMFQKEKIRQVGKFHRFLSVYTNANVKQYFREPLNEDRSILSLVCIYLLLKPKNEDIDAATRFYALSNRENEFLGRIKAGLSYLGKILPDVQLTSREIYHFYQITKDAGVSVCMIYLTSSDLPEKSHKAQQLIAAYFDEFERYMEVIPLLNGNDLIRMFHLEPGPKFRQLLEALKEAQAIGSVSTRTEAETFIARQLK